MGDIIRIVFTIVLLVYVWNNSHWSVGLSLTLIAVSVEVISLIVKKLIDNQNKMIDQLNKTEE